MRCALCCLFLARSGICRVEVRRCRQRRRDGNASSSIIHHPSSIIHHPSGLSTCFARKIPASTEKLCQLATYVRTDRTIQQHTYATVLLHDTYTSYCVVRVRDLDGHSAAANGCQKMIADYGRGQQGGRRVVPLAPCKK